MDMGVCAVDADDVGASSAGVSSGTATLLGTARPIDAQRLRSAVSVLQAEGLKVILVSSRDLSPFVDGHTETIDCSSLLHVKAQNDTVIDLLKVAHEYRCLFVTNADVGALEEDWRLPWRRKKWLNSVLPKLHVRFAFNSEGVFGMALPLSVREYLNSRRHAAESAPSGAVVPPMSRSAPASQHEEGAVHSHAAPLKQVQSTALWLGGEEAPAAAVPPGPPAANAAGPSVPMSPPLLHGVLRHHPLGPEEPPSGWSTDNEWPLAVALRPLQGPAVLCILCEEKSRWLFPYAMELSSTAVLGGQIVETEDSGTLFAHLLSFMATSHWEWDYGTFTISRCVGGPHDGMQAIGLGSSGKARKRAARLALAATIRVRIQFGAMEDPSSDGAFAALVCRSQRLLAAGKEHRANLDEGQNQELPPPPPLGAPPKAVRSPPPPPGLPPSPSPLPVFGLAQARLPVEIMPENPQPSSSSIGLRDVEQAFCQEMDLTGRVVVAVATYQAESSGYLPLRPRDRLLIQCDRCHGPGKTDQFFSYIYGKRIDGPSNLEICPSSGWFPYDLVRFVQTSEHQPKEHC